MIPPPAPAPVPTPAQAAEDARLELERYTQAQLELARRRRAEQQQQQQQMGNPITSAVGHAAIDSVLGGGEAAAIPETPMVLNGTQVAPAPGAASSLTTPPSSLLGQAAGALVAIKGGADTYNALNQGGKGLQAGLGQMGGGIGTLVGGPVGGAIGAVGGNVLGYGIKNKGPLGTAALAAVAPPLAMGRLMGFGPERLLHKSTKQYEQERWGEVAENSGIDPNTVGHFFQMAHPEGDTGEGWTKEVEAASMKDAQAMAGQLGMLQTFGKDYFENMNEFQRFAATQAAIENNLLDADKGDILVTDPEKLREIAPSYYADERIQQRYNAEKAKQAAAAPPPASGQDFDATLEASLSGLQAQARADAKQDQVRSLMLSAAQPMSVPKVGGGGGIRTGVDNLDSILSGVLG